MKKWLIFGTLLIVLGLAVFGAAMTAYGWDFTKLSTVEYETNTVEYETNTYEFSEEFTCLSLDADVADVSILPAADGVCRVACYEERKMKHSVAVEDGTLVIRAADQREWFDRVGIFTGFPEITVWLPEGMAAEQMEIKVTTGDIHMETVSTDAVNISTTTGDVVLTGVLAEHELNIRGTTGDVRFDGCDAPKITVRASTGSVKGSLLTGKEFNAQTTTGSVKVPADAPGGTCEVTTTTGSIKLEVQ